MPNVLIVEDDPASREALEEILRVEGFAAESVGTLAEARERVETRPPDLLMIDLCLPDGNGMELVEELEGRPIELLVMTGYASIDTAIDAIRRGAADYLTKPIDVQRLRAVLTGLTRTLDLKNEVGDLRSELRKLGRFGPLIGASPQMNEVYDLITKVAPTDVTVFIHGESGTGKELVAQAIHRLSRRRRAPFLPLNCGAMSPTLIESELFGHERGSFTGAERSHKGYFERANGGTLLLDEITEMPIELQVKLLRVLETGVMMRLGGEKPLEVDVRVLAATNRIPSEAVKEGKLREDLLYRLNVFPIYLPPLRERGEDIGLLTTRFLEELNREQGRNVRVSPDSLALMRRYSWPGNIRELKNLVHRAFILAAEEITPDCLPVDLHRDSPGLSPIAAPEGTPTLQVRVGESVDQAERRLVLATLEFCQGNKQKAAEILGISLKTLYNRINRYRSQ